MRKLETWGLALVGTFALGTIAWADGPTKGDSGPLVKADPSPSWIARFFADDDQGPPWRVKAKKQKDRFEKERLENESANKAVRKQADRDKTDDKKSKEETAKREQDAAAIQLPGGQIAQKIEAVSPGHSKIQHQHVGPVDAHRLQRACGIRAACRH